MDSWREFVLALLLDEQGISEEVYNNLVDYAIEAGLELPVGIDASLGRFYIESEDVSWDFV